MSGQPALNIIADDEMHSQCIINAPVAAPNIGAQVQTPTRQQYETPFGLRLWPQSPMAQAIQVPAPIAQSSVFAERSGVAPTVPVTGGSVQPSAITPTIPMDVPSH